MDGKKIAEVAKAYYDNLSNDEKFEAWKFYVSLDTNGTGTISHGEYINYLEKQGHDDLRNSFEMLDKNGDGVLNFNECITLLYIIRAGRILCDGCGAHMWDIYFVCVACYEAGGTTYDLCSDCYRKKKFTHQHGVFSDNFKLLRDMKPTTARATQLHGKKGYDDLRNSFEMLDKNGDGVLDYNECITLFYIIKVRHIRCNGNGCGAHPWDIHFFCVACYEAGGTTYYLCSDCYREKKFTHQHEMFSDNYNLLRDMQPTAARATQEQSPPKKETEGIFEAAMAHYENLTESDKERVRKRFAEMDSDGDGKVGRKEYWDYITKAYLDYITSHYGHEHQQNLFDNLDRNGDGMLDFDEYKTCDFVYERRGYSCCRGCSLALWGTYFVCVDCYDAGKRYKICCKCYGGKSYQHKPGHNNFRDIDSLTWKRIPKPASAAQELEKLASIATLYYNKSSSDIKKSADKFFKSLDNDKDGKVSLHEFLGLMRDTGHVQLSRREFFEALDKDGKGTLGFMEVMALYYIIKSGRPFCAGCDHLIVDMYFTCSKCFDNGQNSFCLCTKCFKDGKFVHEHDQFLDNYAFLEAKRMQVIATNSEQHEASSSLTITGLPTSKNAVVPYTPRPPRPRWEQLRYRASEARVRLLEVVAGAAESVAVPFTKPARVRFERALDTGLCTIM